MEFVDGSAHSETSEEAFLVKGPTAASGRTVLDSDMRKRGNSNTCIENFPTLSTRKLSDALTFYKKQQARTKPDGFVRYLKGVHQLEKDVEVHHEVII